MVDPYVLRKKYHMMFKKQSLFGSPFYVCSLLQVHVPKQLKKWLFDGAARGSKPVPALLQY